MQPQQQRRRQDNRVRPSPSKYWMLTLNNPGEYRPTLENTSNNILYMIYQEEQVLTHHLQSNLFFFFFLTHSDFF